MRRAGGALEPVKEVLTAFEGIEGGRYAFFSTVAPSAPEAWLRRRGHVPDL